MDERELFARALGLSRPWYVERIAFDEGKKRLDLFLAFEKGSRFPCPECGQGEPCAVHDTRERTWRHLDFFQHQAYLTAKVPRVNCPQHGIHQVMVPWARPGSGFTLLFEALTLCLAREMTVKGMAGMMHCSAGAVWHILHQYVAATVLRERYTKMKRVGIDETSVRKGHQYITTFCDLEAARVAYVAEGRGTATFWEFRRFLETHGGTPSQVTDICMDMWGPYILGARTVFPGAAVTFDRYHVMLLMNRAIDRVRRMDTHQKYPCRGARYLWLRNPENLTVSQRSRLAEIQRLDRRTARAYHLKLALQRLWDQPTPAAATAYLKRWYFWATHSRLPHVVLVARAIKAHWNGVLQFITSRITTGIVEGLNSKIKTAMKRAYGFKSFVYLRTIIYLVAGKLDFALPTQA